MRHEYENERQLSWICWLKVFLIVFGLLCVIAGQNTSGQTTTWLGGDGNWSDSEKWDNGVPDQASIVHIDDGNATESQVTISEFVTINSLTLNADDVLNIASRLHFKAEATLTNDGLIQFIGTGFIWLRLDNGNLVIDGSGTIRMNGGANAINGFAVTDPPVLTNGPGHTIEGAGGLGTGINTINQGLIHANLTGLTMTIGAADHLFTNTGTIRVSNGSRARMAVQHYLGDGGLLEAIGADSRLIFGSCLIEDATFNATDGGSVSADVYNLGRLHELHDVTNLGLYLAPDTNLFDSFINSGEVRVLNAQTLAFESDFPLTGGGVINMVQGGNIAGSFAMNNVDNTLAGYGDVDIVSIFGAQSTISPGIPSDPSRVFDFHAPATFDGTIVIDLNGPDIDGQLPIISQVNRGSTFLSDTEIDQLNILSASATFDTNVNIEVNLADDYMPDVGDFFDIITADQIIVTDTIGLTFPTLPGRAFTTEMLTLFDPDAAVDRDVLRITTIPTPSTLTFLAFATLCTGLRRSDNHQVAK